MNPLYNFAEVILCIYAVIKHIFKRNPSKHDAETFGLLEIIFEISCILISLLIYVTGAIVLLPFMVFKKIIDQYLKLKHGERYCGLLENMDSMWMAETQESKHIVTVLVFMELKKSPEQFVLRLRESIKEANYIQFLSTLHHILNYTYRLHSAEIVDHVIRLIPLTADEKSSKSKFEEKISKLANQPLPPTAPYEVLVCADPISFNNWHDEQVNERKYVAILRSHHSVGDGIGLMQFLIKLGNYKSNYEQIVNKLPSNNNIEAKEISKRILQELKKKEALSLNQIIHRVRSISLYRWNMLAQADKSILHGPALTGQKIVAFDFDHDSKYFLKIKSIRRQLKDCRFSDVLYTAVSASLFEHFKQYSLDIPKNISMSYITTCPRKTANPNQEIEYAFAAVTLDIPIHIDGYRSACDNLILRLETIKARRRILEQSVDSLLFYWISHYFSLLPISLLRVLVNWEMKKSTVAFSNLPGLRYTELGGEKVENIIFCAPHVVNVGLGFTSHTYGDCLQIGLMIDRGLANPEQTRAIIDNVYKFIDLLDDEVNSKK